MPVAKGGKGGQHEQNLQSHLEQNKELLCGGKRNRKTQREGSYFRNRRRCRQQAGGAGAVRLAAGCVSDGVLQHARGVGSGGSGSWQCNT